MTRASSVNRGYGFDYEAGMESIRVQLPHQVVGRGSRVFGVRRGVSEMKSAPQATPHAAFDALTAIVVAKLRELDDDGDPWPAALAEAG